MRELVIDELKKVIETASESKLRSYPEFREFVAELGDYENLKNMSDEELLKAYAFAYAMEF